jgi:hypothetical protein
MKYTIAGDDTVVSAMRDGLLERTVRDGFMHIKGEELKDAMASEHYMVLATQDILTMSCTYLGEPLAAIVFFRDATSYFNENDEATLKAIGPIFATALATVVRDPGQMEPGDTPFSDGSVVDEDEENRDGNTRRNEDWWKRGEPPPF